MRFYQSKELVTFLILSAFLIVSLYIKRCMEGNLEVPVSL